MFSRRRPGSFCREGEIPASAGMTGVFPVIPIFPSPPHFSLVIPAKAGLSLPERERDSRLRGNDKWGAGRALFAEREAPAFTGTFSHRGSLSLIDQVG